MRRRKAELEAAEPYDVEDLLRNGLDVRHAILWFDILQTAEACLVNVNILRCDQVLIRPNSWLGCLIH